MITQGIYRHNYFFIFIFTFVYFLFFVFVLPAHITVHHMCAYYHRDQKTLTDALKMELGGMSYHITCGCWGFKP